MEIFNRKARFNYTILEEYECGIELFGTEIKSIRKGNANINDAYGRIKNNEVFITNLYISKYEEGNLFNHDERRERKLLLHKSEIRKIQSLVKLKGYALIPLKVYIKGSKAKLLIGICKGKKLYDKKETIKERDIERESRVKEKYM